MEIGTPRTEILQENLGRIPRPFDKSIPKVENVVKSEEVMSAAGKQYPRKRVQCTHVSFNQDLDPIREIFTQKINVNPKKTLEILDWLRNLGQETNSYKCPKLIKSLVNVFRHRA